MLAARRSAVPSPQNTASFYSGVNIRKFVISLAIYPKWKSLSGENFSQRKRKCISVSASHIPSLLWAALKVCVFVFLLPCGAHEPVSGRNNSPFLMSDAETQPIYIQIPVYFGVKCYDSIVLNIDIFECFIITWGLEIGPNVLFSTMKSKKA